MIDALQAALRVAGSGLSAQSARLRVVSENLANAQSTGATPGADPYPAQDHHLREHLRPGRRAGIWWG